MYTSVTICIRPSFYLQTTDCNFDDTCEVTNCHDQTVTCAKSRIQNEPCACRRIRGYLNRDDIDININNIQMQCRQELCTVSCDDGFIGDDVMYLCNDSSNCCTPTGDKEILCERGLLTLKIMCIIDILCLTLN